MRENIFVNRSGPYDKDGVFNDFRAAARHMFSLRSWVISAASRDAREAVNAHKIVHAKFLSGAFSVCRDGTKMAASFWHQYNCTDACLINVH